MHRSIWFSSETGYGCFKMEIYFFWIPESYLYIKNWRNFQKTEFRFMLQRTRVIYSLSRQLYYLSGANQAYLDGYSATEKTNGQSWIWITKLSLRSFNIRLNEKKFYYSVGLIRAVYNQWWWFSNSSYLEEYFQKERSFKWNQHPRVLNVETGKVMVLW